jgi:hypothetical protein
VRRLTVDELLDIGDGIGAGDADPEGLAVIVHRQGDDEEIVAVIAVLLVLIVQMRPFWRRDRAVAIAAADLLARLNNRDLDLTPVDEVQQLLERIAHNQIEPLDVGIWVFGRLRLHRPVPGPRCSGCGMPLREALEVSRDGRSLLLVPVCAGCGAVLGRPFHHRPLQEA